MPEKVFIIAVQKKDKEESYFPFECYTTFEKAKKHIYETAKKFPNRQLKETGYKNRFAVMDENGKHLHTLVICDIHVR